MANNATIAGHVQIGDGAILGGYTTVHQFCKLGPWSMSAANSAVFKDIPAFVMVGGNPASAHGMNFEGMRRRGYSSELIAALRKAYKTVYRQGLTLVDALLIIEESASRYPEIALYRDSILASTRGITR
jgi:UDP-N-acetylglucosamine acyltransferase